MLQHPSEGLMTNGILVPVVDFSGFAEDEFNDWYDLEHIPERQRVPGFLACQRWIGADNPKISVATYELNSVDVLKSPAYHAIGNHALGSDNLSVWSKRVTARVKILMRFEGEQILSGGGMTPKDAPALLLNVMSVAPEHEHEFNEWYNTEHIPALAAVSGTLCARRYRGTSTAAQRYLALYHLASAEVPNSTAWKEAANTPWTERMRPHFRDHICGSSADATAVARLERGPGTGLASAQILCVSYAQGLADKLARDCRSIMMSPWYRRIFPTRLPSASRAGIHHHPPGIPDCDLHRPRADRTRR